MVLIDPWFMSWQGTAVIGVVVLQNSMDLVKGWLGSSSEICVTSTVDENQLTGMEAERVSNIKQEDVDEAATNPVIKTEPNVSGVSVVSVTHILYGLYVDLPAHVSVCPYEKDLTQENGFKAIF